MTSEEFDIVIEFLKSTHVVFAITIVLVSSVATVAVAIITTRSQMKIRSMELFFKAKSKAFSDLLNCVESLDASMVLTEQEKKRLHYFCDMAQVVASKDTAREIDRMGGLILIVDELHTGGAVENSSTKHNEYMDCKGRVMDMMHSELLQYTSGWKK